MVLFKLTEFCQFSNFELYFSEWLLQLHQDLVGPQGWDLGVWHERLRPTVHLESCKYHSDNNNLCVHTMEVMFPKWNITSPAVNKHMFDVYVRGAAFATLEVFQKLHIKWLLLLYIVSRFVMAGVKDYRGSRNRE